MSNHIPIPVTEAKQLAFEYRKSVVLILSYDPSSELTHMTTYGMTPSAKDAAAHWGDEIVKFVGCDLSKRTDFEDYRTGSDEARNELLWEACRDLVHAPHQEHMIARLNDQEAAAYERIQKLVAAKGDAQ